MTNFRLLGALLGASLALMSCEKAGCVDTISGVILGGTCVDGAVIEVDAQYPIGRPVRLRQTATDSLVGTNAIATGTPLSPDFKRGQRIYFRTAAGQTKPEGVCPTIAPLDIPHLHLVNVSTLACEIE